MDQGEISTWRDWSGGNLGRPYVLVGRSIGVDKRRNREYSRKSRLTLSFMISECVSYHPEEFTFYSKENIFIYLSKGWLKNCTFGEILGQQCVC